ncbi:SMP-30/gluconolactonase/LRE family protein [Streptomyces sp. NPDC020800]|uniref:SMP-30/gluconolactonase/LRE family protein n=1 Tax=Streptomyces sp. NPDC020800 TaxID=3365092 RepID=UPI00378E6131
MRRRPAFAYPGHSRRRTCGLTAELPQPPSTVTWVSGSPPRAPGSACSSPTASLPGWHGPKSGPAGRCRPGPRQHHRCLTLDGRTMYLADSARGTIHRYLVDPATRHISEPEAFVTLAETSTDGMVVDAEGTLWCAVRGTAQYADICQMPPSAVPFTCPPPNRPASAWRTRPPA